MATIYHVGDTINYTVSFSNTNTYLYGHVYLTLESQNADNKTSTISARLYLYRSGSNTPTTQTVFRGAFSVDGQSQEYSTYIETLGTSEQLVCQAYFNVSHLTDGSFSKTLSVSCSYGSRPISTASEVLNLPSISTSASFTISPTGTLHVGNSITVSINSPDNTWKYTLQVRNTQGQTQTIFQDHTSTTWTGALPSAVSSLFPNSSSATLYFDLTPKTANNTELAKYTVYRTVAIGTNGPTISNIVPSAVNASGQPLSLGFISGVSYLKLTFTVVDNTGSTVSNVKSIIDNYEVNASIVGTSGTLMTQHPLGTAGSAVPITLVATNARGGTTTETITINVAEYYMPRIDILSAIRCDTSGNAKPESPHGKITWRFAVTTNIGNNKYDYTITIREHNTSGTWSVLKSETNQTAATVDTFQIFQNTFEPSKTYDVRLQIVDTLTGDNGRASKVVVLGTDQVILDFKYDGSGAAVGVTSEDSGIFDIGWFARFSGGIYPVYLFQGLPSGSSINLNDVKAAGFYYGSTTASYTATNLPSGVSGNYGLTVFPTGASSCLQIVVPEAVGATPTMYLRTVSTSGQVSNWKSI